MALVAPPGDLCYNKQKYRSRMNLPIGERAEKERVVVKIQESAENYLEAILVLSNQNGTVRSIDIAAYLQFSKPSVSRAMSLLRQNGYAEMDKDGLLPSPQRGWRSRSGCMNGIGCYLPGWCHWEFLLTQQQRMPAGWSM